MDKRAWLFVLGGLFLAAALTVFVAPFASSAPDGLERVAEDKGFTGKLEGEPAWSRAPMPDYTAPAVKHSRLSTALAGVAGVLLVFAAAWGIGWTLQGLRRKKTDAQRPAGEGTGAAP
jgi:cobalt/nickel transport protein